MKARVVGTKSKSAKANNTGYFTELLVISTEGKLKVSTNAENKTVSAFLNSNKISIKNTGVINKYIPRDSQKQSCKKTSVWYACK
jgi:hypothetical protein